MASEIYELSNTAILIQGDQFENNLMFTDVIRIFKDVETNNFYPKYCAINFHRYDQEMNATTIGA